MSDRTAIFGIARDPATYSAGRTAGDSSQIAADKDTDALLTLQANLESELDTVSTYPARTSTASVTSVTATATNDTTLLAANATRIGFIIYNGGSTSMVIKFGDGADSATAGQFTYSLGAGSTLQFLVPISYTGRISCDWSGAPTGAASVTELSL